MSQNVSGVKLKRYKCNGIAQANRAAVAFSESGHAQLSVKT